MAGLVTIAALCVVALEQWNFYRPNLRSIDGLAEQLG